MRSSGNKYRSNQGEVGWISTADVFIFGSCFLLLLLLAAARTKNAVEAKLKLSTDRNILLKTQVELLDLGPESQVDRWQALAESEQRLRKELGLSERQLEQSEERLRLAETQTTALLKQLERTQLDSATEKEKLEVLASSERRMREDLISQQRRLNNELVGLGGKLQRVVLMVDVSESMKGMKDSWAPTLAIIERWINNLEVMSAALILFGEDAELVFEMQELNPESRKEIVAILKQIDPTAKATNFLAAFDKAYETPNVDTIIVFSDGLPSVDITGNRILGRQAGESNEAFTSRMRSNIERVLAVHKKISEMAKQHPGVAINAIGLGDGVYNEEVGNLLNELALANGGIFLAVPSNVNEAE